MSGEEENTRPDVAPPDDLPTEPTRISHPPTKPGGQATPARPGSNRPPARLGKTVMPPATPVPPKSASGRPVRMPTEPGIGSDAPRSGPPPLPKRPPASAPPARKSLPEMKKLPTPPRSPSGPPRPPASSRPSAPPKPSMPLRAAPARSTGSARPPTKPSSSRAPASPSTTTASGRPAPTSSRPVGRSPASPSGPVDPGLEQRLGQVRARLELLANRVEKLEKAGSGQNERLTKDLSSLKRDMVRVAALAERGGAVKDHLNRLSRQVDELSGGARATNDVVALDARVSRLARQSEDVRDRLADRLDRLEATVGTAVKALDALTARVEALAEAQAMAPASAASGEAPAAEPKKKPKKAAKKKPKKKPDAQAGGSDDLKKIKGIGPKFEKALHAAGVKRWAEVASWSDEDIDRIADEIGVKAARIRKAGWVTSAKALLDG